MSRSLILQLDDHLYEVLIDRARRQGRSPEDVGAAWLSSMIERSRNPPSGQEVQAAWERLSRHAGAVNGGDPRASENDRIDADLAREYAARPDGQTI